MRIIPFAFFLRKTAKTQHFSSSAPTFKAAGKTLRSRRESQETYHRPRTQKQSRQQHLSQTETSGSEEAQLALCRNASETRRWCLLQFALLTSHHIVLALI